MRVRHLLTLVLAAVACAGDATSASEPSQGSVEICRYREAVAITNIGSVSSAEPGTRIRVSTGNRTTIVNEGGECEFSETPRSELSPEDALLFDRSADALR